MTTEHGTDDFPPGDVLDIELTDTPAGGGGAARAVRVVIDGTVRRQIVEFALTNTGRELGGVLLGAVSRDGEPVVQITAMIPARHTAAGSASVTFTHETWQDILAIKDRAFAKLKIVGWFHTHPGFGIFLSRFDLHIHENFFNLDWQVAYVVDPLAHTEGFFRWENGTVQKTLDFSVAGELPDEPVPGPIPAPAPLPARQAFDWHYLAFAGLLGAVVYLHFFRPPKIAEAPPVKPATEQAAVIPPPEPETMPAPAPGSESARWPVYIVQPNDSLWTISERCYGDGALYHIITAANRLSSDQIVTGMRLRIPGGALPPEGATGEWHAR